MGRPPRVDDHGGEVYVYRRANLPCHICGGEIRTADLAARNLFWCPTCQTSASKRPGAQNPCGSHGATSTRTPPTPPPAPPAAAPAPAPPRPARPGTPRRGRPRPTPVPTGPDPPRPWSARRTRPCVAGQPPTPLVPGAEGVLDLEHHVHRRLVRPRLQRRPHVHQPYVQRVPHPQPHRRMSDTRCCQARPPAGCAPSPSTSGRCEQEPPQRRVRRRVERLQSCSTTVPLGPAASHSGLIAEPRVPDDLARPAPRARTAAATRPPGRSPGRAAAAAPSRAAGPASPAAAAPARAYTASHARRSAQVRVAQPYVVGALRRRQPYPARVDLARSLLRARRRTRTARRSPARRRSARPAARPGARMSSSCRRIMDVSIPRRRCVAATLTIVTPAAGTDAPPGHGQPEAERPRRPHALVTVPDAEGTVVLGEPSHSARSSGAPPPRRRRAPAFSYHLSHSSCRSTRRSSSYAMPTRACGTARISRRRRRISDHATCLARGTSGTSRANAAGPMDRVPNNGSRTRRRAERDRSRPG